MSWIDKVKNPLIITTGDGQEFSFNLWVNASQELEWNESQFNFINIEGTLVKKKKAIGRKFPLEFYYQGQNHIDLSDIFRIALRDERPATLDHPYYGLLAVQILNLKIDNSVLNISKFTGTAYETITENALPSRPDVLEAIQVKKIEIDEICEEELTEEPSITEINTFKNSNEQNYKAGLKIATLPEEAQEYFNAFSTASNAIDVITATPILAIRAAISVITLPAKFQAAVQSRIKTLQDQMSYLRRTLLGIGQHVAGKQIFEVQGMGIISSMCIASVAPLTGDYTNASSVLTIIDIIKGAHRQLLTDLDSLQDDNGGSPDNFIPGALAVGEMNDLVALTLSNLLDIALNGKKEISVVLSEDSNIILLTDKYYGLDPEDENLQKFIDTNGLTVNKNTKDTLILKKGRTIVYYA
jgi:hypothetical protein